MSKWFQSAEPSVGAGVVGRFVDIQIVDIAASKAAEREVLKKVPFLESRIPGSSEIQAQRVKEFNAEEMKALFPGAWEYYQEHRLVDDEPKDVIPVRKVATGHPLHEAEFIPRAKIPFLNELGFSTIEQIATMSDSVAQNLKAIKWRQQAQEQLSRT